MSKSVQDCKSFAAKFNAERERIRQNVRLYTPKVLRLILAGLFSIVFVSNSLAQPQPPDGWVGWGQNANPITSSGTVTGGTLAGGSITGTGANRMFVLTVDGQVLLGNQADGAGTISNLADLIVNAPGFTQSLYLTGASSITNVDTVRVNGGLYNLGRIADGNYDQNNYFGGILSVSGDLYNSKLDGSVGQIINYETIHAGILTNYGDIITKGDLFIETKGDLVNGSRTTLVQEGAYSVIEGHNANTDLFGYSSVGINVGGNLKNNYDGIIRADVGMGGTYYSSDGRTYSMANGITVVGELYNAGEISTYDTWTTRLQNTGTVWTIQAGSILNDGRTDLQMRQSNGLALYETGRDDAAKGWIYDAASIATVTDLTNQGLHAVINGAVNTNTGKAMHIGGDLNNLDRASIFNYAEIIVDGSLNNQGATLVGGHWYTHSALTENGEHPMMYQSGIINVWGNVTNTTENAYGEMNYGGLIASFDTFRVNGSMYNDQYSMITGSYEHQGTDVGASGPGYVVGGFIEMPNPDDPEGEPIQVPVPHTVEGRRANVIGGVLQEGFYYDAPSVLNVMGVFPSTTDDPPPFLGLYNEGHIREIDIISVGTDERGALVNTVSRDVYDPHNTLPTSNGGLTQEGDGDVGASGTITDIGVLNVTNLVNAGTISNIDSAINVSFSLINEAGGTLDGLSESHVQWTYVDSNDPLIPLDPSVIYGMPDFNTSSIVEETTRADLRVGESSSIALVDPLLGAQGTGLSNNQFTTDAAEALSLALGTTVAADGIGIVNEGTITDFEHISSKGTMYHGILSGAAVGTVNSAIIANASSLTVGSSIIDADRADLHSAGAYTNVENVSVTGDLHLYSGSTFTNVGTVTAHHNVFVNGMVGGGFSVLAAKEGTLMVGTAPVNLGVGSPIGGPTAGLSLASLTIDSGTTATGNVVENYGSIIINGLLSSQTTILNEGDIANNGTINAGSNFRNFGNISGNGLIFVGNNNNGKFSNMTGGTISGGIAVDGNFENAGGTIQLNTVGDVIRVTGGTAVINGGIVDASVYQNAVVGGQYLFLSTDPKTNSEGLSGAGNLQFTGNGNELIAGANGNASGSTGTVLDFAPRHGTWDGTKYVAREMWEKNQYYWLEVQRAYQYGGIGVSENQVAVGQYIDMIGATVKQDNSIAVANAVKQGQSASGINTHTGLWNLFAQLDGISDDPTNPLYHPDYADHQSAVNPAARRALDELGGSIYSTLGLTSVYNTGVVNMTLADALRSDVFKFSFIGNPNNAIRGQAIAPLRYNRWATLFGIGGSSQHDGNASGYEQSLGGVMAGVDRAFWTGTRLGAFLSVAGGEVSLKELDERTKTVDLMIGMYLRQEMYFGYGLAIGGFGHDTYKTERNLISLGHSAESRTHGMIGSMYLERGIDLPIYYATIQPFASFQAVMVDMDNFTEGMRNQYGNTASVGLEGIEGKTSSFKLGLGARASSQPVPLPWGQLALTTNMAWYHDFAGKQDRDFIARFTNPGGSNYGTQFNDATFRVYGNDPKQDWFNFGFGLHLDRNSTRFFLDGNLYTNSRQTLFTGNGGVVTSW